MRELRAGAAQQTCGSIACTLARVARNGTVTFTATDTSPEFEELVQNWACHMTRLHIPPLVWALDAATHQKLKAWTELYTVYSEAVSLPQTARPNAYKKPSSDEYTTAVSLKPLVILKVLRHGFDALFLDVDVALARDPLPMLRRSTAALQASLNYDDRPEASRNCGCQGPDLNTGVLFARSSSAPMLALVERWASHTRERHACPRRPPLWSCGDQEQLTRLIKQCGWRPLPFASVASLGSSSHQQRLACDGGVGELSVDTLPPDLFASGASVSKWRRTYPRGRLSPPPELVSFHPNFGGFAGGAKKAALRRVIFQDERGNRGAWCIEPVVKGKAL